MSVTHRVSYFTLTRFGALRFIGAARSSRIPDWISTGTCALSESFQKPRKVVLGPLRQRLAAHKPSEPFQPNQVTLLDWLLGKLNDVGRVGACEGDMDSTLTMLRFAYAFRVPGFISDPVIDTAKNALVHFHCTSATKMDGPGGERLPFTIRNQTDSKGGVALEVENRVGQPVTCAKLVNLDPLLISSGQIIETSTSPLACRTQFAMSVPDARRMFLDWGGDVIKGDVMTLLHRAVFYGDYREATRDLADLMGLKIVEEGGQA